MNHPKQNLLREIENKFTKLIMAFDKSQSIGIEQKIVGNYNYKDLLAHLYEWEAFLLLSLKAISENTIESKKLNIKKMNQEFYQKNQIVTLENIRNQLLSTHKLLVNYLETFNEKLLTLPDPYYQSKHSVLSLIEHCTTSHYDWAISHLNKTLKKKPAAGPGYITAALLISAGVASIVLYGLAFLIITQFRLIQRQHHSTQALAIAEAGINYYRWHLAHAPNDFTDSTGQPGPYVHQYSDPQGGALGNFSLDITPPVSGSNIVTINSTGSTTQFPTLTRSVTVQYGQPSMAQYAFLHDAHVWFGSGLTINGQAHSNGGIRNDALNNSLVTSALATYTCGTETGCNPTQTKNGVWGAGGDQGLWQFPVTPVDFDAISVDFTNMRTAAQSDGIYLGASGNYGYHLTFNNTGTVTIQRVTNASYHRGYDSGVGCQNLYQNITGQANVGTYQQNDIPIIFTEDHVWIEGTVTSPVLVVAARFPIDTNNMNIWIYGNLQYSTQDGSIQAGVIAQNSIYFAKDIPNDLLIHAALLAQKGRVMRHRYNYCTSQSNAVRNSLTIYGSVISALKSYWNWGSPPVSGFTTRNITYDPNLRYNPPPYFPATGEYEFISWTE